MANVENGAENARHERDTYKETVEEHDQIRLVILGHSGIGKSTIVSRVFGIPEEEARVSHDVPGDHDINIGISYPSNRSIIVHDSGGFESGIAAGVQKVSQFMENRRSMKQVKDQIHCIWYCIACEGDRPTQGFAEEFFSNIDKITGEIPVLIIFTKYDKLLDQHQSIIGRQNQEWPYAKTKQYAEGEALKDFESKYRKQVMSKLKNATKKVDWEKVGRLQSPERGGADIGDMYNETGTNDLIAKTLACLAYSLKPMWVRTQRQNAQLKIDESINVGMKNFKSASFLNGIPFVPFKDLAVEMRTSDKIFQNIHRVWNQDEFLFHADKDTQVRMRDAIFDKNLVQQVVSQIWDIFDITGPLSQPNNAVKFMKTVAGLALIHERLFWYQKRQIESMSTFSVREGQGISGAGKSKILPLSPQQVNEEIHAFRTSSLRQRLSAQIEGQLDKYGMNLGKAYSPAEVEKIIRDAIELVLGVGNA